MTVFFEKEGINTVNVTSENLLPLCTIKVTHVDVYVTGICVEENGCCILNRALAAKLSEELMKKDRFLIPNETELEIITGSDEKPEKLV